MIHMPGMAVTDHHFSVPLDHADPGGPGITVFAREIADPAHAGQDLPFLLFLQGGPGGKSPRPPRADGWIAHALRTHRVLLLDQRGTGRSTPVTAATAARLGDDLAAYLRHFRADAIVADAEHIRRALCGDRPWETLGQSYGGFITLTYLSQAPEGLRACYVTGGLPGLAATADEVYARTYPRVRDKVERYYARYPGDVATVAAMAAHLAENDVRLPDGDRLTVRRLQTLGMALGMGDGAERLHWLFDEAWDGAAPSDTFLRQVMALTAFAEQPLYGVLQEVIYAQGGTPTAWAAERALASRPEFAPGPSRRCSPARCSTRSCSRSSAGCAPSRRPPTRWPRRGTGRRCTTPRGSRPTRCRWPRSCTTTTCTSTPSSRCAPPGRWATCGTGSPTSGSTTACAPRATGSCPA